MVEKNLKIDKVELIEQTRGTNRIFTLTSENIIISTNGSLKKTAITTLQWHEITKEIEKINVEKIPDFASPSIDRYSDRAFTSHIIITENGKTYQSADFDAGKPPSELQKIYANLKKSIGNSYKRAKPAFL